MTTTKYLYATATRPLAQNATAWEYLLPDALGSVRQIANANAYIIRTQDYEPYGSMLSSSGSGQSVYGFTGEERDQSGLIFLRARYLQPRLGIFLARDPWSGDTLRPQSLNGFAYVEGNPVNRVDQNGKASTSCEYLPTPEYPGASEVYAEGSAAVATAYFGKWGAWMGVEVAYNLNTLERATFSVRGFVIQRLTLISVGQADYVSGGYGKGVKDYGVNNPQNDLMGDYSGPFINDCASTGVSVGPIGLVSGSVCPYRAKYGDFSGFSAGFFTGPDVSWPFVELKAAISWSELNYTPDRSKYKVYRSVKKMAQDILAGNDSPPQYSPSKIAPALAPFRTAVVARLYDIQTRKGNFYLLQ